MPSPSSNEPILLEPIYGYSRADDIPYRPSATEALADWIDAVNFIKYPSRIFIALFAAYHLSGIIVASNFVVTYASLPLIAFLLISSNCFGVIYNTVWYHRYCSHASYHFKKRFYSLLFLWTNPFVFREECYVIPHLIHHQKPEAIGDPYGPHLGWFGSYLAIESSQKVNVNMSQNTYDALVESVRHIGFPINSYPSFKQTGSLESCNYYVSRILFAQILWGLIFYTLGGLPMFLAWYSSVFVTTCVVRDFNWRGHGGNFRSQKKLGWEFDKRSRALNQRYYGFTVGEWHDNHHRYPMSANNAFLPGQVDISFQFIRLMYWLGIVESYVDARPIFERQCLGAREKGPASVSRSDASHEKS